MTATEATAEVFWTAFQTLRREAQRAVLAHLVKEQALRRDLVDLACIEERRAEPERPLGACLEDRARSG